MIVTVTTNPTKVGNVKITDITLQCDACEKHFASKRRTRDIKRTTHWCSRKCIGAGLQSGGEIRKIADKNSLERWGVPHPSQHPDVEAKRAKTSMERFGTLSPMQVPAHKELRRQNTLAKYGVANVIQNPDVLQKRQSTLLKRYGVKGPMAIPEVYAKVDWQAMVRKNHEAMKRNKTYRKSKAEDQMYKLLVERFGETDVERQAKPAGTNWPIDFYVRSIDTWIQVDGIYWHGLDRPLEENIKAGTPRSEAIVGKWHVDRAQDAWFAERDMLLIRITDQELNNDYELPKILK